MANRFKRRKPIPSSYLRSSPQVTIGPYKLSPFDAHILNEYMRNGFKGKDAIVSSGVPPAGAHTAAYRVLHKPEVIGALSYLLVERRKRVDIELDEVVRYWFEMATADAREFNPLVWRCCRYCWGIDNQYQFTQAELRAAYQKHQAKFARLPAEKRPLFDEEGGIGFDSRKEPQRGQDWGDKANDQHSCPECNGKGVPIIEEVDLSKLSYGASLIFDGIKVCRDGSVEFKLNNNRSKGMEEVAKLLGMAPRRHIATPNFDDMEAPELDALLDEAETRGLISPGDYRSGQVIDAESSKK